MHDGHTDTVANPYMLVYDSAVHWAWKLQPRQSWYLLHYNCCGHARSISMHTITLKVTATDFIQDVDARQYMHAASQTP